MIPVISKVVAFTLGLTTGVPITGPYGGGPSNIKLIAPEISVFSRKIPQVAAGVGVPVLLQGNYLSGIPAIPLAMGFLEGRTKLIGQLHAFVRVGVAGPVPTGLVGLAPGPQVMTEIGGKVVGTKKFPLGIRMGWLHFSNGSVNRLNTGLDYLSVGLEVAF